MQKVSARSRFRHAIFAGFFLNAGRAQKCWWPTRIMTDTEKMANPRIQNTLEEYVAFLGTPYTSRVSEVTFSRKEGRSGTDAYARQETAEEIEPLSQRMGRWCCEMATRFRVAWNNEKKWERFFSQPDRTVYPTFQDDGSTYDPRVRTTPLQPMDLRVGDVITFRDTTRLADRSKVTTKSAEH